MKKKKKKREKKKRNNKSCPKIYAVQLLIYRTHERYSFWVTDVT